MSRPRQVPEPESGVSSPQIIRKVVVLPEPFGPRKPVMRPSSTLMVRSLTTRLSPKLLFRPSTSMARRLGASSPWPSSLRASATSAALPQGRDIDGQTRRQVTRMIGRSLDQEDQLLAAFAAVDHRRGEFRRRADEDYGGAQAPGASVAAEGHAAARLVEAHLPLWHVEAQPHPVVGQLRQRRLVGGSPFTALEEHVLH